MSLILFFLTGCDHDNRQFWNIPSDVPAVTDLGVLTMIDVEAVKNNSRTLTGLDGLVYSQLGAPETGALKGGATAEFLGTGGAVCVIIDPEAVFWNQNITKDGGSYTYQDNFQDDADLDLYVGLSAYYTGSPGVEIGNFELPYTDSAGMEHYLDFNECNRDVPGHAGRASVEYCDIDTTNRAGIPFTILMRTWALPLNDGIINYGVAVVNAACSEIPTNECAIKFEGAATPGTDDGVFGPLEDAYCGSADKLNEYCAAHLADKPAPCAEGYQPYN